MKIIKQFKKKSNTFGKKVCNKFPSNLKLIKFQRKLSKLKEIPLTTPSANNITLLLIRVKVLIDIKVPVKSQAKETQLNIRLLIKN